MLLVVLELFGLRIHGVQEAMEGDRAVEGERATGRATGREKTESNAMKRTRKEKKKEKKGKKIYQKEGYSKT